MPERLRRILFPPFARRAAASLLERPFGRLVAHFLARMGRGDRDAASEFELGAGALLGLLAAPGAFQCFLLLDKYSTFLNWFRGRLRQNVFVTSIDDKYLFLTLAMAITGIITTLKWDRILPDSQDYLNLAPLPVRPRTILLANAAAVAIAVLVFAVDVNGLPTIFFPLFVTASAELNFAAFLNFAAAHAVCVMLASGFVFCGVFAVLGTLSALLPRDAFRACAAWVRGILLVGFVMLLLAGFAGATFVRDLHRNPDSLIRYLPSMWFLGLYQSLQHHATPALEHLARLAWNGTGAAFAIMALSYSLSYRRRFRAVLEMVRTPLQQRFLAAALACLDLFARRAPAFQRACHAFTVRALLRNETHRLAIAVSLGLGWLLGFQSASEALPSGLDRAGLPAAAILEAPLIGAYLLILGLRLAFQIPAKVPANWTFRSILDARENETAGVARLIVLSFLVPAVAIPWLVMAFRLWGFWSAAVSTLYLTALSLSVTEIQFAGYRKIPLTCPVPGFRDNFLMLCLLQFLGFELFTRLGAGLEHWMFAQPWRFLLVPAGMAAAWDWNRRRIRNAREAGELEEGLVFENAPVRAVERLDLSA